MSYEPTSDLDWQAFVYVSGEMSPAESESFEELLGVDQSAREAVAATVKLLSKMAAASPADVTAAPRPPNRQRYISVAIAAAAALVVVSISLTQREPADTDPVRELVSLWVDSDGTTGDATETDAGAPMNDEDLNVPGWLLAAIESSDETED
jgi:hypothetical protein